MSSDLHSSSNPWAFRLLILVATAVGAALRFIPVKYFNFYGDEFWTLQWIQAPVGEILSFFGRGLTMHLYILLIKAWTSVVGISPLMIKLPSLIAGIALIPLVYWLGKQWLQRDAAALAAVMTALSSQMIVQSRNARVYAILTLAVLLSMFLFARVLRNGSKLDFLVLAFVNAGLLALSVHSVFVLLVQGVFLVLQMLPSRRLPTRRFLICAGSIALSVILALIFYHRTLPGITSIAKSASRLPKDPTVATAKPSEKVDPPMMVAAANPPWLTVRKIWFPFKANHQIASGLMALCLVAGSGIAWFRYPSTGRLLVLWALTPTLLYFFQRAHIPEGSVARYLLPALPAQLLLISLGVLTVLRLLLFRSRPVLALGSMVLVLSWASYDSPKYHRVLKRQWEPTHQAMQRILEIVEPGDLVTSFPEQFHHFFKLNLGPAAVMLPTLVNKRSMPSPGRLLILTRIQPKSRLWLEQYFDIEEFGDWRYNRRLHLLVSKKVPAGPDALRGPIEQFYYSLLGSVVDGSQLHQHNIRAHFRMLRRVHTRLERLTKKAGKVEEMHEHRRLISNPQHWGGDMKLFPVVLARVEAFRSSATDEASGGAVLSGSDPG